MESKRTAVWPHLAEARRRAIRDSFTRPADPEWVRRIEAAHAEITQVEDLLGQRKLAKAINEAVDYVDKLVIEHAHDEHPEGVHADCPCCFPQQLDPDELLREHRGW